MIITKVRLECFGRHKEKEFKSAAPVVGLLGKNGSGKSTFLAALEFAITGLLRDKAETYIRHGAKRATVEVHFLKNGQEGVITRKITPSSTARELVWQGKTYTKAADVDGIMADILGADRQAISNAVFLEQGSLDKMLFSNQTEREQLFSRMLNVSFLDKFTAIVDSKTKQLSAGIEDLSVVFDEVAAQTKAAELDLHRLNGEASAMPDVTERLNSVIETITTVSAYTESKDRLIGARVVEFSARRELDEALRAYAINDVGDLESRIRLAEEERDRLIKESQKLRDLEVKQKEVERLTSEIAALQGRVQAVVQELATHAGRPVPDTEAISLELQAAIKRDALANNLVGEQATMVAASQAQQAHAATARPNPDISGIQVAIDAKQEKLADIRQEWQVLKAVLGVHQQTTSTCPCCRQTINPALLDKARLVELEAAGKALKTEVDTAVAEKLAAEREVREWDATQQRLTDNLQAAAMRVAQSSLALQAITVTTSVADLQAKLKEATEYRQKIEHLLKTKTDSEAQQVILQSNLERTRVPELASFRAEEIGKVSAALVENQNVRTKLAQAKTVTSDARRKLDTAAANVSAAGIQTNAAEAKLIRLGLDVNALPSLETLNLEKTDLSGKQQAKSEALGRARQARAQYDALLAKLVEIENRKARNASKQMVVQELARIRDVLSRGNLPMAYVTYQFQRLAVITQEVLNEMEAPFVIEVDPETPVSFRFTRLDEPDAQSLDMSKLSGGQRVRLSIAFLIAVQRLILPDVGLMVLDEPTTHLDEAGVESLKDLLISMSRILENTSSQVWIVDHNPALQAALGASVNLEK
jgi:exonuclease SbcC